MAKLPQAEITPRIKPAPTKTLLVVVSAYNKDAYLRTDPAYQTLPDRAIIEFGTDDLPKETRFHFTAGDFNYAVKSEYERIADSVWKVGHTEWSGFKDLDAKLVARPSFKTTFSKFQPLSTTGAQAFSLSYYGLPEPSIDRREFRPYWVLIVCVGILVAGIAVFQRIRIARR